MSRSLLSLHRFLLLWKSMLLRLLCCRQWQCRRAGPHPIHPPRSRLPRHLPPLLDALQVPAKTRYDPAVVPIRFGLGGPLDAQFWWSWPGELEQGFWEETEFGS